MLRLQLGRRKTGVVAAELVDLRGQGRVVAGVPEEHRAQLAIRAGDLEDRHGVIDRTVRVDSDLDAGRRCLAAIDREPGGACTVFDRGRGEVADGGADGRHHVVDELVLVHEQLLLLGGREHRQVHEIRPDHRTGVGMAGVDQQLRPFEPVLLLDSCGDRVGHDARNAHHIRADDDDPPARPAFERPAPWPKGA